MDFGLRAWLIVICVIVIAGIIFDGWRSMSGSRSKIRLDVDKNLANQFDSDPGNPELLGQVRVRRTEEPVLGSDDMAESSEDVLSGIGREKPSVRLQPEQAALNLDEPSVGEPILAEKPTREAAAKAKPKKTAREGTRPVEEVLVINVLATSPEGFKGPALLQSILESGLRFGEMDIFHRHESMAGNGEVLFSMANAIKPGTFDLDDIESFATPAVTFFLTLPGSRHPKQALDLMIAATRKLSQELGGELKDDKRSVLTAQTIEHYRHRLAEFERRKLTVRP